MTNYTFKDILLESEISDVKKLLQENNLSYEPTVTSTVGLYDYNRLIATGSLDKNVIKMIAVDSRYQSENLSSRILSYLLSILQSKQVSHYFLFTKPENKKVFTNFNFREVIETDTVVLYENKEQDITETLNVLKKELPNKVKSRGAIVMNLNPMTLGHLYLIEKALERCDDLIVFLVEEDNSIINYETRLDILKKTVKHLKNVYILPSTSYLISNATFPTYFLKDQNKMDVYTALDIGIFKKYFMPIFEIDLRIVGEEPLDILTNTYNLTMKKIIGNHVLVIPRKSLDNQIISASLVRKLAKKKDFDTIKRFVPEATYEFLTSEKGRRLFND